MIKRNIVKIKRTVEITEYIGKCKVCDKSIKGSTEGQVNYNLNLHEATHEVKKDE